MGNTCQNNRNLMPSIYLAEPKKQTQQPDNNASQLSHQLPSHPRIIKPLLLQHSERHSKFIITSEMKRCNKNFSNLCLKLGNEKSQQIKIRRILNKTHHIVTLDLDLCSTKLGLGKQFTAFITSLKRYKKIPNLQINYANLPYENFKKFCFALKHLKAPKKLNVELWYNRYTRHHKAKPMIRALKQSRDLRDFSVELVSIEDLMPKSLEKLFSSLKGHKNLQNLKVKCLEFTRIQANAFNKAMKSLCHLKLSDVCLEIGQREHTDTFKELFVVLTNFAPSLQRLSLWPHLYGDNFIVFSQHFSKFTQLSHLKIRGHPSGNLVFPYYESLMNGLKSMKNLPADFRVGSGFPWEEYNKIVNQQDFTQLYPRLAFSKWSYSVKVSINKEGELTLHKCYLENLQPSPSNSSILQVDFTACDRIQDLTSFLDQVNLSQELFIEFCKVDISGLKKTFESLKRFSSLASFTISFTRNYQIDQKWIENLFDLLLTQLPSSVTFLKLCFAECIHLNPDDIKFMTSSLAKLGKMKNLTGLGLNFVDLIQFTDENGVELAKELKQMTQLTNLELYFKGCYMLKDQGVIEIVKTMSGLQKGKALFEDCWYIAQSAIDLYHMESNNLSVNFKNCKQGQ